MAPLECVVAAMNSSSGRGALSLSGPTLRGPAGRWLELAGSLFAKCVLWQRTDRSLARTLASASTVTYVSLVPEPTTLWMLRHGALLTS